MNEAPNVILNRLCKWRAHFAGWQLGTRSLDDPEAQAVRDHRELSMLCRVELSALTGLLIQKGFFTLDEFEQAIKLEAQELMQSYERRWPGARSSDLGMHYDLPKAQPWMSKWKP